MAYAECKPKQIIFDISEVRLKVMGNFFKGMITNTGVVGEVMIFLWQRKLWWLIPMVAVLLLFGLLLIFANASGVAPFIYTLF